MENPDQHQAAHGETGSLPETAATGRKVCSACGTVNEATSTYCYKCGVRLPEETHAPREAVGTPAGFWIRLGAFLVDQLVLGVVGIVLLMLVSGLSPLELLARQIDPSAPVIWREYWLTLGLEAAYFTLTTGAWGRTIGKALLGLKVTRVDGSRVSYVRSFFRYLAYYISWFTMGFGFLAIAATPRKRGLHDFACDTQVIRL